MRSPVWEALSLGGTPRCGPLGRYPSSTNAGSLRRFRDARFFWTAHNHNDQSGQAQRDRQDNDDPIPVFPCDYVLIKPCGRFFIELDERFWRRTDLGTRPRSRESNDQAEREDRPKYSCGNRPAHRLQSAAVGLLFR